MDVLLQIVTYTEAWLRDQARIVRDLPGQRSATIYVAPCIAGRRTKGDYVLGITRLSSPGMKDRQIRSRM